MNSFQTLNRYPHLSAWSQCTQSKAAGSNPLPPLVWSVMRRVGGYRGGGDAGKRCELTDREVAVWSLYSAVLSHSESSYQSISAKHKVSSASWPENINIDLNTLFSLCFQLVGLQKAIISSCPSIHPFNFPSLRVLHSGSQVCWSQSQLSIKWNSFTWLNMIF